MKLYNHLTKKVEEISLGQEVSVYTCGPTVYDYPHIGNWYTFIRYDILVRALRASGHNVNWVMNITDVGHLVSDSDSGEDKIEKGAKREGKTAWDIAKLYTDYFLEGLKLLNFGKVTHLPKATDYIDKQIELVKILEDKGYTYSISDGIYFNTSKFANYANFAELDLQGQEQGARVEINEEKRNPSDFALWKFSPSEEKRDMEWDSPWGKGFPGWHLECSAMIHELLGQPIDIHAGGVDHIPVHHTNEVAQSEAAFGLPLAKYWMHCNHIQVNGQKMSKSLGNFYTLEDIRSKQYSELHFRMQVLGGHYRSQSEFSWDTLDAAKNRMQNWVDKLCYKIQISSDGATAPEYKSDLIEVIENDLNTPQCLALVDEHVENISSKDVQAYINLLDELFGLDIKKYFIEPSMDLTKLIDDRKKAREDKDWARSDKLRLELENAGIRIKDTEMGQIWSRFV